MRPIKIPEHLAPILQEMLYDLMGNRLTVDLVPGNDPCKTEEGRLIRAAVILNPDWYRKFCKDHPCTRAKRRTDRKDYTRIKRKDTIMMLENAIKLGQSKSTYMEYLLDMAEATHKFYLHAEQQEEEFYMAMAMDDSSPDEVPF